MGLKAREEQMPWRYLPSAAAPVASNRMIGTQWEVHWSTEGQLVVCLRSTAMVAAELLSMPPTVMIATTMVVV
jgi:hypothetical protein